MGFHEICNSGLSLCLASNETPKVHVYFDHNQQMKKQSLKSADLLPSLTLGLSSELTTHQETAVAYNSSKFELEPIKLHKQASSVSAVSSFSNTSVKREKEVSCEELDLVKTCSKVVSDDQDEEGGVRKKLRLTKEQSVLLEESFKEHITLNPKQKQALAKRLNLRPRQVEVWFQNRRARTKLKQTEVDCELLKKCCETLRDENRRLQKEVLELRALKLTAPFYMQLSAATLTMCPSCETISGVAENSSENHSIGTKPHFYTHPSAAC